MLAEIAVTTLTVFGAPGAVECPASFGPAGEPEPGYAVAVGPHEGMVRFISEAEMLGAPSWPVTIDEDARRRIADRLYRPAEALTCEFMGPTVVLPAA